MITKIQAIEKNEFKEKEEKIKKEDIITNLIENWHLLPKSEKRQFLVKFVDKIIVSSKKTSAKSRIVRIEDVQFHTF